VVAVGLLFALPLTVALILFLLIRLYKLPDGKEPNILEFGGEVKGTEFAAKIVRTAHAAWREVVTTSTSSAIVDLCVSFSAFRPNAR
jgi:hypothetical protein